MQVFALRTGRALGMAGLVAVAVVASSKAASSQTDGQRQIAATLNTWGLTGNWSLDCSKPPSRNNGYLNYIIQQPGIAMHVRYFGDTQDQHEVLGARHVADGGLELTVRFNFKDGDQTRRYVMIRQGNRIRAISNVNVATGDASIRNGRFVHNSAETPWQNRCAGSETSGGAAPQ